MNKRLLNAVFVISALFIISSNAFAKVAAFGYFTNESGNESFDYLEKILPNSFASTLKNKFKFDVIKPAKLSSVYPDENSGLAKSIIEEELPYITDNISADYFIYGSFKPLENNRLKLTVFVYKLGTTSVFQFEEIGYFEAEIFRLVDRIAVQISNIASDSLLYKKDIVTSKSKLAIITNLDGEELNSLYYEMLTADYKIFPFQGDDIYPIVNNNDINRFYHISGVNASYHRIHSRKEAFLPYGTWSSPEYMKNIKENKNIYESSIFSYRDTKKETIKKIRAIHNDGADYILIIGFDDDRERAWIRCLNLKDNRLMITESEISGSSLNDVTKKIITSISTKPAEKK